MKETQALIDYRLGKHGTKEIISQSKLEQWGLFNVAMIAWAVGLRVLLGGTDGLCEGSRGAVWVMGLSASEGYKGVMFICGYTTAGWPCLTILGCVWWQFGPMFARSRWLMLPHLPGNPCPSLEVTTRGRRGGESRLSSVDSDGGEIAGDNGARLT